MLYLLFSNSGFLVLWDALAAMAAVALIVAGRRPGRDQRRAWLLLAAITTLGYIVGRLTTFDLHTWYDSVASIALWLAEALGIFQQIILYRQLWTTRKEPSWLPVDGDDGLPTADIFIPTVNESLAILRRTIVGCTEQQYPKEKLTIYVCDDGNREAVQTLAATYGVRCLARPSLDHAKAGNLNWALAHSTGEYVVLFDADMVPKPDGVRALLRPLLADSQCAFAQAPQAFFNPDPFQHNLGLHHDLPNEQDFFMRELEAARSQFDAVLFVGSNAAFRRKALNSVGGFPTATLTEDAAVSVLLQAAGWRTAFVPRIVAEGLAPESFAELLGQRDRWCRGNFQVAKRWNPLTMPGLSRMQRLIYLSSTLYWLFGLQKVAYLLAPLLYLDLDIRSISAPVMKLAALWLPSFIMQFIVFRRITRRSRTFWWSHVYEVIQAPVLALSALSGISGVGRKGFRVTAKDLHQNRATVVWPTLVVFVVLLSASLWGFVQAAAMVAHNAIDSGLVVSAAFWTVYNAAAVVAGIAVSIDRPRWRHSERFRIDEPHLVVFENQPPIELQIRDLSEGGCSLIVAEGQAAQIKPTSLVTIQLGTIDVQGDLIGRQLQQGTVAYRVKFRALNPDQYRAIFHLTFARLSPFEPRPDPIAVRMIGKMMMRLRGNSHRATGDSRTGDALNDAGNLYSA